MVSLGRLRKRSAEGDLRLATSITVVVLVVIASGEVFRVELGDLLVGKTVADPRVELIQCLPLKLVVVVGEEAGGGNGASQG